MSTAVSTREARAFLHASDIPDDVWCALLEVEAAANVIFSFAKKARTFARRDDKEQLWVAVYDCANNVEFVLSCTKGTLGNYPIFVVACKASFRLVKEEGRATDLADSLRTLVRCLLDEVPPQRIFSVFSVARVTEQFAEVFVAEAHARGAHQVHAIVEPYYDATFTFCTSKTLLFPDLTYRTQGSEQVEIELRRADMSHLDGVRVLCQAFSETSPPFVLDDARAALEAKTMIENNQVWVHMIKRDANEPEIACLVAATRESDNVVAITKVFAPEHMRRGGCAKRLLHRVCAEIFKSKNKRVVLYVGNTEETKPARNLYNAIGFQGLGELQTQQRVEGVERWLEIGFEGTELGHW